MLRAYLDESYSPQRMLIAGFIGSDVEWEKVGGLWAEALAKRDAPYFHACELNMQLGPFKRWETWRCDALKKACAEVLAESSLDEISAGFTGDWSEITRQCPGIANRFPNPYAFVFDLAVAQMQRAGRKWYAGDMVACVFDSKDDHEKRAHDIFESQRGANGLWANIQSVTYGDDKKQIELQCADMLANELLNAPRRGAENLPLLSTIHKRGRRASLRRQWDETLIRIYERDPDLTEIFYPPEPLDR